MKVVNFYGGPGSGKSTMAARVFSELKEHGVNAELVTEFAKDLTWQESMKVLDNQIYVFAKQFHRVWRLQDKVDFIVTDSPLMCSLIYGTTSETFKRLVVEEFNKFDNVNVYLQRVKKYNPAGRSQTEVEATKLDERTLRTLGPLITFDATLPGNKESLNPIMTLLGYP